MRSLVTPLAIVLAINFLHQCAIANAAAPKGGTKESTDEAEQELKGTWKVTSIGGNGKSLPDEQLAGMKVTISGKRFTTKKGAKVIEEAKITADTSKEPRTLDLAFTQGELKGQTVLGIFELNDNVLRIALGEPGKPRPTEIVNRVGLRQDVWELQRE